MPSPALIHRHAEPSYKAGYARNASESANPGLWVGLGDAWYPRFGAVREARVPNLVRPQFDWDFWRFNTGNNNAYRVRHGQRELTYNTVGSDRAMEAGTTNYTPPWSGSHLTVLVTWTTDIWTNFKPWIAYYPESTSVDEWYIRQGTTAGSVQFVLRNAADAIIVNTDLALGGTGVNTRYTAAFSLSVPNGCEMIARDSKGGFSRVVDSSVGTTGLSTLFDRFRIGSFGNGSWGINNVALWSRALTRSELHQVVFDPVAPFRFRKRVVSYPVSAPPATSIAGSATAVAETLGALTISHVVAGSATAIADTLGALTISHVVAGDTTAVAETLGSLAVSAPGGIAGQASAVAETLGALTITAPVIPLAGTSTAVADTIGDLTLAPPQAIAGSSTAVGATNGNLAINVPGGVTGRTSGVVDTAGELAITHVVAGTCTAVSDTVGSLSLTGPGAVSGSSTAVADTAGTLAATAPELISGSSTAVADTLGSLTITHVIAGSATAVCDTLGFIPVGTFTPVPCRICTPADSNPTCVVPDSNPTCKSTEC